MSLVSRWSLPKRWRKPAWAVLLVLALVAAAPLLQSLELKAIGYYRKHGVWFRPNHSQCQYQPTCSRYGQAVIEQEGFFWGNLYLARRLSVCSPLGWAIRKANGTPSEPHGPAPGDVWHEPPPKERK